MARFSARGLSPRVRGNLLAMPVSGISTRSIPACAGEPGLRVPLPTATAVYPRVCGGTGRRPAPSIPPTGLSPRVRGNRAMTAWGPLRGRSIPACAGEPVLNELEVARPGVYPRVCGGTEKSTEVDVEPEGLSPRVRGNLEAWRAEADRLRSIPACAGEPQLGRLGSGHRGVYPRVCGGTAPQAKRRPTSTGLSPRVRGNPFCSDFECPQSGSIPACAGEPQPAPSHASPFEVYPRVCGGTPPSRASGVPQCGLSPRVRGNPTSPHR